MYFMKAIRTHVHANFTVTIPFSSKALSYSSNEGSFTCAFFAYARCTALELCPNACWANRSGYPHVLARSAQAYRYEWSDTPLMPDPRQRCLNSVDRSPARTVM